MAARGLGKGLDSLIPASTVSPKTATKKEEVVKEATPVTEGEGGKETVVKITKVSPNKDQPRREFNKERLEELADSIKKYGLLEPILVQDREDYYEIIAGERRWRAARIAGLKEVPVIIRKYTEREILEISLIENLQREDLNKIEEAVAYKRLVDEFHLKQEEIAERVSKSRTAITNAMRLLKLEKEIQDMIIDGKLQEGHARALLGIEETSKQLEVANKIVKDNLSVREVEKLVKDINKPEKAKAESKLNPELDIFYKDIAEKLKQKLGTKVNVTGKGDGQGKIEIEFYSNDDLDRLFAKMK